ncbi:hypothetical protein CcaverHIS002_0211900 [Cutaneotrichosporon cavernicola]|uniref:SGNH hydrolase-type esterase domain-containing protein n=1 Tax=Cutaneotrichosporon cavernicola TaxID=279322 RepID=A0AA48I8L6_9TREE|nr:uncharacterized protein CcaverHIS019_0211920 [Cutaneotrichosporon cavernicola]BEI82030.1 hypothetical protein CcaverHIS002_0211900 [Cutaneotrichosporon cavernicola]BEI89830.1 hypothetical protein CcaverHIS019_0211920 [Cutaneotrichosporon cavernicola]BEJ05379.1 hypothetical protein CcaverHIS641_0211960 [Cutaneotrichosporon cavernicola]
MSPRALLTMSSLIRPTRFGLLLVGIMALVLTVFYRDLLPPVPPMLPEGSEWSKSLDHVPYFGANQQAKNIERARAMWTCDRCLVNETLCEKFGTRNVDLSRAFDGSGARVQRVLKKAMAGEPIVTGGMGGSISKGHGCKCDPWHIQMFQWWNQTFPHPENRHADGAVGARGSDYFKYCHHEHLDPDVDIIFIETSVNDLMSDINFDNFEALLRALLSYPKSPAIVILQTVKLNSPIRYGSEHQFGLAGYYDVPVINIRNWLFPAFFQNTTSVENWFLPNDLLHPNAEGHQVMAELIQMYLYQQMCYLNNSRPQIRPGNAAIVTQEDAFDVYSIPPLRMGQRFSQDFQPEEELRPGCASVDSKTSPLQPVLSETKDWELWEQPGTKGEKKFWRATEIGAQITFEVNLQVGYVDAYFLKSPKNKLGAVECWLDDEKEPKKIDRLEGYWSRPESIGQFQKFAFGRKDSLLPTGKHKIHCEIVDKTSSKEKEVKDRTTFQFIGIFTV